MQTAQQGGYDGTIFHRAIKNGMVQGGDPLSKDPSKRSQYGTGGLNAVKAEARAAKMTRGSVAAVTIPGKPDSAGAQFFIVLADQPALDGQYTVFGHVSDGMEALMKISQTPVDAAGLVADRAEIQHVDDPRYTARAVHQRIGRGSGRATARCSIRAPVRSRSSSFRTRRRKPFGSSCGWPMPACTTGWRFIASRQDSSFRPARCRRRSAPLTEKQQKLVHNLQPEFNDTKHVKGIVSMARGDEPDSASTSFFICTGPSTALDGVYTAFGRVVDGMAAVDTIEAAPRTGETPNERIDLRTVRIVTQR